MGLFCGDFDGENAIDSIMRVLRKLSANAGKDFSADGSCGCCSIQTDRLWRGMAECEGLLNFGLYAVDFAAH